MQIINAIVSLFQTAFRRFFRTKKKEHFEEATESAVSSEQWTTTTSAISSFVPTIYASKKQEFAHSIIELVRSTSFISELSKRIDTVQADSEDEYVELCSLETKKLILEMLEK